MPNLTHQQLETAAIDAHRRRDTWHTFWSAYGKHAVAMEPHDRGRFHRLLRRLTALVAAGDDAGQQAAGDGDPWTKEEEPSYPATDDQTQARCLWTPEATA